MPGLILYCVYSNPPAQPGAIDVQATGANGADWIFKAGSGVFSFVRPDGNPSNIPFDGTITEIGSATWSVVPRDQTILLHINDPPVCAGLYDGDPGTCFVKPGQASACILDHGETNVAYNAIPFGAADCPGASLGFEATGTAEFGDEVERKAGTGRDLVSLKVLFSSYACQTGHWFDGTCSTTTSPAIFTLPITANIYAVADWSGAPCQGALLRTATTTQTVPYRPSADPLHCTGADQGKWFNPVAGLCKNQISTVLTVTDFTIPPGAPGTLPDKVIWTVAFNTTHYGATPIGESATCFGSSGGCPFDSFNVGAQTFPGAPYAGSDVFPNGAWRNGVG